MVLGTYPYTSTESAGDSLVINFAVLEAVKSKVLEALIKTASAEVKRDEYYLRVSHDRGMFRAVATPGLSTMTLASKPDATTTLASFSRGDRVRKDDRLIVRGATPERDWNTAGSSRSSKSIRNRRPTKSGVPPMARARSR